MKKAQRLYSHPLFRNGKLGPLNRVADGGNRYVLESGDSMILNVPHNRWVNKEEQPVEY